MSPLLFSTSLRSERTGDGEPTSKVAQIITGPPMNAVRTPAPMSTGSDNATPNPSGTNPSTSQPSSTAITADSRAADDGGCRGPVSWRASQGSLTARCSLICRSTWDW
jgi:hypothetical protein